MNVAVDYWIIMRLVFAVELIIACNMFAFGQKKKTNFYLRQMISVVSCVVISVILGASGYYIMTTLVKAEIYWWLTYPLINLITHIIIFASIIAQIAICYDEKASMVLFCSIAGYAVHDIAMQLSNIIGTLFPIVSFRWHNNINLVGGIVWFITYASVYIGMYFIFGRSKQSITEIAKHYSKRIIVLFLSVIGVSLSLRSMTIYYHGESRALYLALMICEICCCLIILFAQFLLIRNIIDKKEFDIECYLARQRASQYAFTKENIDIINVKCHDIKHQLMRLKSGGADDKYIDELGKAITFYDSVVKTGNEAFDTVITDKRFYCAENKIQFTCIADGTSISFMSASDIYSLFGNAIDNAIEYVLKLEPEKRIIKLSVMKKDDFIEIVCKNYFNNGQLDYEGGLPKTTKGDIDYHGFGMKSMKRIAESYGGSLIVLVEKKQFILRILLSEKR